jgi:anti-sigma factor RsiW
MTCDQAVERLDALLDGELGAEERAAIEAHLAGCADCTASFRSLKALSSSLRAAPYHRAPASLRGDVRRALRGGKIASVPAWRTNVTPSLVGAFVGFACAVLLMRPTLPPPGEAVARHSEAMLSDALVEVKSSDHHQVKPWFSRHVDFSPPLPDLAANGFPLAGGRTAALEGKTAAVLVYQRRLHVIDVFVRPAAGGDAQPQSSKERGFNIVAWRQGSFAFTAVSDLNGEELSQFVALMRTSIGP